MIILDSDKCTSYLGGIGDEVSILDTIIKVSQERVLSVFGFEETSNSSVDLIRFFSIGAFNFFLMGFAESSQSLEIFRSEIRIFQK